MVLLSLSFGYDADVFTSNQSPGHSPEVIVALVFLELWECKQGKHLTLPINNNPDLTSCNLFELWPFVYQHPASQSLQHQEHLRSFQAKIWTGHQSACDQQLNKGNAQFGLTFEVF